MAQQHQQQNEPLYTVTVEMMHRKISPEWLTVGAATDTLAHLVEWAAPANPQITPPEAPLTAETVRQFVAAVAAQPEFEWRVHVEPAPEATGNPSNWGSKNSGVTPKTRQSPATSPAEGA